MPKKTKREKLLADKHRHMSLSSPSYSSISPSPAVNVQSQTFSYHASEMKVSQKAVKEDNVELSIIRHDLLKTIILAIIAIGIELGTYWYIRAK